MILFWNFNHFVVLEGFDERAACTSTIPRKVRARSRSTSSTDAFSGVVLTFKPGPEFKPGGTPPDMLAALRRRLAGSEAALALRRDLRPVPGGARSAWCRPSRECSSTRSGRRPGMAVRPLLLGMGVAALVQGAHVAAAVLPAAARDQARAHHVGRFFHHVLRLPVAYFAQRFAGEIGSRVLINDKVAQAHLRQARHHRSSTA